eukprot:1687829-Ditylum_brightwellii.AAC.1
MLRLDSPWDRLPYHKSKENSLHQKESPHLPKRPEHRKKKISPPASLDEGTPPVVLDAILTDKDPPFPPVDEPPIPPNSLLTPGALISPTPDSTNNSTPIVPLAQNEDSD